jgi:uncharacterized protein YecE (DUF72 family)
LEGELDRELQLVTGRPARSGPGILVGTAGWSLPRAVQEEFAGEGSHLARYARVFPAAEINTSFYRAHRPSVYDRWANTTPEGFRFSLKVPKTITHELRLVGGSEPLDAFLDESAALGARRACLLVQLPPSLAFDAAVAEQFLEMVRQRWAEGLALEPRHASWFTRSASALLERFDVGRVAADPVRAEGGEAPAGSHTLAYYRLHGSPRTYYSRYDADYLAALADRLRAHRAAGVTTWCIFDNTASGAAAANALDLLRLLET